jgi:hypothetical protein
MASLSTQNGHLRDLSSFFVVFAGWELGKGVQLAAGCPYCDDIESYRDEYGGFRLVLDSDSIN